MQQNMLAEREHQQGQKIKVWSDKEIQEGEEWDENIREKLSDADIILLLISSDFMASEYIWNVEVKKALERHNHKEAKVIPIFLRDVDFKGTPFEKLQGYPRDARSISSFANIDEAFAQIARGIRNDIDAFKKY